MEKLSMGRVLPRENSQDEALELEFVEQLIRDRSDKFQKTLREYLIIKITVLKLVQRQLDHPLTGKRVNQICKLKKKQKKARRSTENSFLHIYKQFFIVRIELLRESLRLCGFFEVLMEALENVPESLIIRKLGYVLIGNICRYDYNTFNGVLSPMYGKDCFDMFEEIMFTVKKRQRKQNTEKPRQESKKIGKKIHLFERLSIREKVFQKRAISEIERRIVYDEEMEMMQIVYKQRNRMWCSASAACDGIESWDKALVFPFVHEENCSFFMEKKIWRLLTNTLVEYVDGKKRIHSISVLNEILRCFGVLSRMNNFNQFFEKKLKTLLLLLRLLCKHIEVVETTWQIMRILINMSRDEEFREMMGTFSLVDLVKEIMKKHVETKEVVLECFGLLGNMCFRSKRNLSLVHKAKVIPDIDKALRHYLHMFPDGFDVVVETVFCFENFALDARNRLQIVNASTLRDLISICLHKQQFAGLKEEIIFGLCKIILNFSFDPEMRDYLLMINSLDLVFDALKNFAHFNAKMVHLAFQTLGSLAVTERARDSLIKPSNAIVLLVAARKYKKDKIVMFEFIRIVVNVAFDVSHQEKLREMGFFDIIMRCVTHFRITGITAIGLQAFTNACHEAPMTILYLLDINLAKILSDADYIRILSNPQEEPNAESALFEDTIMERRNLHRKYLRFVLILLKEHVADRDFVQYRLCTVLMVVLRLYDDTEFLTLSAICLARLSNHEMFFEEVVKLGGLEETNRILTYSVDGMLSKKCIKVLFHIVKNSKKQDRPFWNYVLSKIHRSFDIRFVVEALRMFVLDEIFVLNGLKFLVLMLQSKYRRSLMNVLLSAEAETTLWEIMDFYSVAGPTNEIVKYVVQISDMYKMTKL